MKLHLGCGSNYKHGYVNVDACNEKADIVTKIEELTFDQDSIEEILIEHTFEHFDRPTAIGLLIKWHSWLKNGGKLIIVTPDVEKSFAQILSNGLSFQTKQRILRHCFGSHENDYSIHKDGWYRDKFLFILTKLGYAVTEISSIKIPSNPERYDIRVEAVKGKQLSQRDICENIRKIVDLSLFSGEGRLFDYYIKKINEISGLANDNDKKENNIVALFFSKDRALQLDLALRTFKKHCKGKCDIKVLYKCSDVHIQSHYLRLTDYHPDVDFFEETDFRSNVFYLLSGYLTVLFSTDDSIYCRDFNISEISDFLTKPSKSDNVTFNGKAEEKHIGFSLRLGKNTVSCYMAGDVTQSLPQFKEIDGFLSYKWNDAEHDFGYPLELSSSVYRVADIINIGYRTTFDCPNTMEFCLDRLKHVLKDAPYLACYPVSVAFANPINVVQKVYNNRHGRLSADLLSVYFHMGYRINDVFDDFIPNSCHQVVNIDLSHFKINIDNPKLSIIMVTYNGISKLQHAVSSVMRNTNTPFELIVIDNRKDEESIKFLTQFQDITIIRNDSNMGPAFSRNQGLKIAKGDFIAFIDDDVVVPRNWDSKFMKYFESLPDLGMLGPKSNVASGNQLVTKCGYSSLYEYEKFVDYFEGTHDGLQLTLRLAAFCIFLRRQVVETIGGMDTSFGLFGFEDDDYSLRAHLAGFTIAIANDIFIHHDGGPFNQMNDQYRNWMLQSFKSFKEKWKLPDVEYGEPLDYTEICNQKFDIERNYIPL